MYKLVFATNNKHKIQEISDIIGDKFLIISLGEIRCFEEIPEDFTSLEENALQKAKYVYEKYGYSCFADDTGLEVFALNGEPGVFSARYAVPECNSLNNIAKLLDNLKNIEDRRARFRTVIALIIDGEKFFFEGIVNGHIGFTPKGNNGFGYDPVFIPENFKKTFAELNSDEKNLISHRAVAVRKLIDFLNDFLDKNEQ